MKKKKVTLHLDGARCWNAALYLGVNMKTYTKDFDLISACFSKGMGCPAGSLIIGSHSAINEARNLRKMLGGGMRQGAGIMSVCGNIALDDWEEKLTADNQNAKWMAKELAGIKGVCLNPEEVETNIVRFTFEPKVLKDLKTDYSEISKRLYDDKVWVTIGFMKNNIRAVTHRDVSRTDCEKLVSAVKAVLKQ